MDYGECWTMHTGLELFHAQLSFVCGGYTVFTLSVCVRACVRSYIRNVLFP